MSAEKVALDAVLESSKHVEQQLFDVSARNGKLECENEDLRRQLDRINTMTRRPATAEDGCEAMTPQGMKAQAQLRERCRHCGR